MSLLRSCSSATLSESRADRPQPGICAESRADFKVINGENMAGGLGITPSLAMEMLEAGADAITTGNHVWKKREIIPYLMAEQRVIRPLNYPPGTPGFGSTVVRKNGKAICVANIEGRTFMASLDCPFRSMEDFLTTNGDQAACHCGFPRRGDIGKDRYGLVSRREGRVRGGHAYSCSDRRRNDTAPGNGLYNGPGHDRACPIRS